jgi:hypothetical protein
VLKSKGITIPRPKYSSDAAEEDENGHEADEEEAGADDDEENEEPQKSNKLEKFKLKANFEATSDEDEG